MLTTTLFLLLGIVAVHGSWQVANHEDPSAPRRLSRLFGRWAYHAKTGGCLLMAKAKAKAACAALIEQRLEAAERLLDGSAVWSERVGLEAGLHPRYARWLEDIHRARREAAVGLRAHARLAVAKMDRLLADGGDSASAGAALSSEAVRHPGASLRPFSPRFNPNSIKVA